MSDSQLGYLIVVASAFFNGSFVAFSKIESVARAEVHPFLFNLYTAFGVIMSCMLVTPFLSLVHAPVSFTIEGFIAGALFIGASSFSFLAASKIGLGIGQGVWSGAAILISFLWGTLGPPPIGNPCESVPLSILALAVLLTGVIGIIQCETLGPFLRYKLGWGSPGGRSEDARSQKSGRGASQRGASLDSNGSELGAAQEVEVRRASGEDIEVGLVGGGASERLVGLACALVVGVFGGSILAPASFAGPQYSGDSAIAFLPSFGIGSLTTACVFTGCWYLSKSRSGDAPKLQLRSCLWAGLCSGATWNMGNICSMLAINTFGVPFGVAYPMLQTSLVVGGLLGIFVFREIRDRSAILVFFACAAIVVGGALMLGTFGPEASPHPKHAPPSPPQMPL